MSPAVAAGSWSGVGRCSMECSTTPASRCQWQGGLRWSKNHSPPCLLTTMGRQLHREVAWHPRAFEFPAWKATGICCRTLEAELSIRFAWAWWTCHQRVRWCNLASDPSLCSQQTRVGTSAQAKPNSFLDPSYNIYFYVFRFGPMRWL